MHYTEKNRLIRQSEAFRLPKISSSYAFTIVELLIVIVIIGVLAAITIISYTGITARATTASLQSDLANAKKKLDLYYAENSSYPTALDINKCPSAPKIDTNNCLKPSSGSDFIYNGNETSFNLTSSKGSVQYGISNNSGPIAITQPSDCPSGFIPVPGSATYKTKGFCVMKYEAKNAGGNTPVSTAAGVPWATITQTDAINYSSNVAGCVGCHLISEAEWMTLAQNVLSVSSNWSGGSIGNGYIFSGHNDSNPNNALEADTNDSNSYINTGQASGNQKRTLTLTNGEIIWDMAGNVREWTSGLTTSGVKSQPGATGGVYAWREYTEITNSGTLEVNVLPNGTGLPGTNNWSGGTTNTGRIYSNSEDTALHGFIRGGRWYDGSYAGVLSLLMVYYSTHNAADVGFRVSR